MSFATPTSITQTVAFLSRPLALLIPSSFIPAIQNILTSTLHAAYIPTSKLVLTLSPSSLPPRPIYAACIASGVRWSDWMEVLGGKEMDIYVLPSSAVVKFQGGEATLWRATPVIRPSPLIIRGVSPDQSTVPISKYALKATPAKDLKSTLNSGITRRTLAQQILESDTDAEEELFAMLNKSCVISPTPTRTSFPTSITSPSPFAVESPISEDSDSQCTDSSRPSSRSSLFSSHSHTSNDSMSSFASIPPPQLKVTPPTPSSAAPRLFLAPRRAAPCPKPTPEQPKEQVYIDKSKKQIQAYLYEGGRSTVLTGGVMLGAPSAAKNTGAQQQKYRVPGRRNNSAAQSESWRRAVVARI